MRAQFRSRIRLILAGVICIAIVIVIRLYFIQIVLGRHTQKPIDNLLLAGVFDRGSVCFRLKDGTPISAATLSTGFLVAINPQTLGDPAYAAITAVASLYSLRYIYSCGCEERRFTLK